MADKITLDVLGIDEIGHAELASHRLLGRIGVDADDLAGADKLEALDDIETNAAEAEHDRG